MSEGVTAKAAQISVPETLNEIRDRMLRLALQARKMREDLTGQSNPEHEQATDEKKSVEMQVRELLAPLAEIEDCVVAVLHRFGYGIPDDSPSALKLPAPKVVTPRMKRK